MKKMTNTTERLEWAMDFTRLDLANLRAGDKLNLREDLALFLGRVPGGYQPGRDIAGFVLSAIGNLENPTDDEIARLQSKARELLEAAVGRQKDHLKLRSLAKIRWQVVGDLAEGFFIHLWGPYQELFLFLLGKLITDQRAGDFCRCSECSGLFLRRDGRQIYCLPRCRNRVSQRADRARKAPAAKARAKKKKGGRRVSKKR